eukprot:TRINITY_DN124996_c0_g1_i1.p1 TRINITY_DN124996_c0_g1~~TRINITY_DN124996_c0_g1_i1.p1  ORF type:complete len:721 (-),score=178.85 TRINITY_DN124996_c0_g1_i1:88-2250(-)
MAPLRAQPGDDMESPRSPTSPTSSPTVKLAALYEAVGDDEGSRLLIEALTNGGKRYLLHGWRLELDLEGALEVPHVEVAQVLHRFANVNLKDADTRDKLGDSVVLKSTLSVEDIAPACANNLQCFRRWIKEKFGSPRSFFEAISPLDGTPVTKSVFRRICGSFGLEFNSKELDEIFHCCDYEGLGHLEYPQLVFLEVDKRKRELEMFTLESQQKQQMWSRWNLMADMYTEEKKKDLPPQHRLALRAWERTELDKLPRMVCERKRERQQTAKQRGKRAKRNFEAHMKRVYGSVVRAWRREIDPKGSFHLSLSGLRKVCTKCQAPVDINTLWRSLDIDSSGTVTFQEVCPRNAPVLAKFLHWARQCVGSCAALWDQPAAQLTRRAQKSNGRWGAGVSQKKMLYAAFSKAVVEMGCPLMQDAALRSLLLASLDLLGCGFVSPGDLAWLDMWEPPQWLYAEPDPAAWSKLQRRIRKVHPHPLSQWRELLDKDDSNQVSWDEFVAACKQVGFQGNVAGAWRVLDEDGSGHITMAEYHPESAELLASFKSWADKNFGTVGLLFKAMDADGNGEVTFLEMKRMTTKLHWRGDLHLLFDYLDADKAVNEEGIRTVTEGELEFLDSWGVDDDGQLDDGAIADQHHQQSSGSVLLPRLEASASLPSLASAAPAAAAARSDQALSATQGLPTLHKPGSQDMLRTFHSALAGPSWQDAMRSTHLSKWRARFS